jgi:hypothetical protein
MKRIGRMTLRFVPLLVVLGLVASPALGVGSKVPSEERRKKPKISTPGLLNLIACTTAERVLER